MKLTDRALLVAELAHDGQLDKAGNPYILHPMVVAGLVSNFKTTEDMVAAAYLHDVLEDSSLTPVGLRELGFNERIIELVVLLTRTPNVHADDYYRKISLDEQALFIKLCDIAHNTSPERLNHLDEKTQARLRKKYSHALSILNGSTIAELHEGLGFEFD